MKSPFKFLDAFTLKDKDTFFGRDQEIDSLYTLVFKTPMVLVYGLSGTGKTSIIQCGLASRFDGPDWYPIFIRRNNNINSSLSVVMRNALGSLAKDNLAENVSLLLRKTLRPVYLLFDQFEELFILGKEEEQKIFMQSLRELLDAQLPSKIVLIMREEYIGQLYNYETLIPELFDHRFRVEPMGPTKVKSVISSSFEKFNIQLAEPKEELLDTMVRNINDPRTGITLPYLQVYLDMLYRDKYRKQYGQGEAEGYPKLDITAADIASVGRIDNVLERFLDNQTRELRSELVQRFKTVKPDVIQQVLDVFVTEEGTKKPVGYKQSGNDIILEEEVAVVLHDIPAPMLTEIINSLQQDRILRRGEENLELAHDTLALVIDGRRSESQRQLQNIRKRLANAYEEFQKTGAFLNQKQLAAFDEYRPQLGLSDEMEGFLVKCEQEVDRQAIEDRDRLQQENKMAEQKKLARTRKIWLVIVLVFAGLAVFMAIKFYNEKEAFKEKDNNLDVYAVRLDEELRTKNNTLDSLNNVLLQVGMLVPKIDTMARSEKTINRIQLSRFVLSLKSAISHDTLSQEEKTEMLTQYISIVPNSIFFTSKIPKNPKDLSKAIPDTAFQHKAVFVVFQVKTPKATGDLEVKWLNANGEILNDPTYKTVDGSKSDKNKLQWLSFPAIIGELGTFRVEVTNGGGLEIGRKSFSRIQGTSDTDGVTMNESPDPITEDSSEYNIDKLYVLKFFTMSSGSLNAPGPETTKFKVGQMIHYYISLNSPESGETVSVKLMDSDDEPVWVDTYTTAFNTSETGYRLWRYHGAREPGEYYVVLVDSEGTELGKKGITIE